MIRRPPRSTQSRSSAASDVYKRQDHERDAEGPDEADAGVDDLSAELTQRAVLATDGAPVEQGGDDAPHPLKDAVPSDGLGGVRAVGEEPDGQDAPQAVEAVNGDRAAGVVDLGLLVEELDGVADDEPGDDADHDRGPRGDERARRRDGDEP